MLYLKYISIFYSIYFSVKSISWKYSWKWFHGKIGIHLSVHSLEIFINIGTPLGDVGSVNICQSSMICKFHEKNISNLPNFFFQLYRFYLFIFTFGRFFGLAHQLFPDLHWWKQLPSITSNKKKNNHCISFGIMHPTSYLVGFW